MRKFILFLCLVLSFSASAQYPKTTSVFGNAPLPIPEPRPISQKTMQDSVEIADWYFQNAYSAWNIDKDSVRAKLLYDTMLIYLPLILLDTDPHRFGHFYAQLLRFYWDQCYDHEYGKWISKSKTLKGYALQRKIDSIFLDYMDKRKLIVGSEKYQKDFKWQQARDARGINQSWDFVSLVNRYKL